MSRGSNLRIGVTGHRAVALAPLTLMRLQDAISSAFSALKQGAAEISKQARPNDNRHGLQVVSALAEGADRMVAAVGLAHGAALVAVLPFSRAAYLQDFPEERSRQDFMRLLAEAAEVIELDGRITSEESRNAAYSAVGEAVVARSDLIFALWDGRPPNGPGGTSEIVEYARRRGCPVLWFKLDHDGEAQPEPSLLLSQRTITSSAVEALITHLKKTRT
jgi:hypothetical protein